jgi:tRNA (guanine-N7-)-methyltransferase
LKNSIKSFSKARSRSSLKNKKILSKANEIFFITEDDFEDFKLLNEDPFKLNLEIGFGDGKYLSEQALNNPKQSFIGIEVFESGLANTYKKIEKFNITNLKLIQGDVEQIFSKNKSKNLFDLITIFFPDPWPKSKHKKRRLLKKNFFLILQSLLKKEGKIIIKTDWQDYAEEIIETLKDLKFNFDQESVNVDSKELITKYEEIALKEKRKIMTFLIPSIN